MALTLRPNPEQQAQLEHMMERFGYTTASGFFIDMLGKYETLHDDHQDLLEQHGEKCQQLRRLRYTVNQKLNADKQLAEALEE